MFPLKRFCFPVLFFSSNFCDVENILPVLCVYWTRVYRRAKHKCNDYFSDIDLIYSHVM